MLLSPKCAFLNIIVLSCLFESLYNLSQPVGAIEFPKSDFFFFFYCLLMEQFNLLLLLLHFLQIGNQIQRPEWTQVQSLWQYYTWCFILSLEDTIISVWFLLFYDFNCWWGSRPRSTYYWRFQNCDVLSFCFHISWNDFINRNLPMCINWLLIHIK